ncbi:MAG: hypothetical protein MJZ27_04060 [Bacteroidales bacterium]|nr:hypothetical protein [Bacteroidales bacterium]
MRYSSQKYLRTDGTIGLWPVIETDDNGTITSIKEYPNGIPEMGHHFFESGLIICTPPDLLTLYIDSLYTVYRQTLLSESKEEFISKIQEVFGLNSSKDPISLIGLKAHIYHISGFDINSFKAETVSIRQLS